jgi:hypothetical protein
LEEVGLCVASTRTQRLIRKLGDATAVASALTALLWQLAECLRQLAHLIGWAVLIVSAIILMIHPVLSPTHFLAPGAGTLAILQSIVKPPRRRHDGTASAQAQAGEPELETPLTLVATDE